MLLPEQIYLLLHQSFCFVKVFSTFLKLVQYTKCIRGGHFKIQRNGHCHLKTHSSLLGFYVDFCYQSDSLITPTFNAYRRHGACIRTASQSATVLVHRRIKKQYDSARWAMSWKVQAHRILISSTLVTPESG